MPAGVLRVGMIHDHYQLVYNLLRSSRDRLDLGAAGSKIADEHNRAFLPAIPCEYLAYGIRFEADFTRRFPDPDQPLKPLLFGRFDEGQKGISMFSKIVVELDRRCVPYQRTFHGHGPDEQLLTGPLAPQVEEGKERFLQPVNHRELGTFLQKPPGQIGTILAGNPNNQRFVSSESKRQAVFGFNSAKSASTIMRTNSVNFTFGSQPSCFLALAGSPISSSTSAGRS